MISVPNDCPFKEEIMKEVADYKAKKEEERLERRRQWLQEQQQKKAAPKDLQTLVTDAQKRQETDRLISDETDKPSVHTKQESSLKAFYKEFKKVTFNIYLFLLKIESHSFQFS